MRKQPPLLSHCRAKASLDNARSFFIILVTVRENSFFGSLSCKQFVALKIVLNSFQIRECINVWAFLNCLVWKQLKTPQRWVSLTTNACLIYLLIKLIRVLRETHGSWVFLFFKRMILKKQHPPPKKRTEEEMRKPHDKTWKTDSPNCHAEVWHKHQPYRSPESSWLSRSLVWRCVKRAVGFISVWYEMLSWAQAEWAQNWFFEVEYHN